MLQTTDYKSKDATVTMSANSEEKTNDKIPNSAFDSEYMTEWVREVKYLASKGIRYTFVKRTPDYNIKQYKYTKTPELFIALAEFYYQTNNEKTFNKLSQVIADAITKNRADQGSKTLTAGDLGG